MRIMNFITPKCALSMLLRALSKDDTSYRDPNMQMCY